jgi:hypothetical protein
VGRVLEIGGAIVSHPSEPPLYEPPSHRATEPPSVKYHR